MIEYAGDLLCGTEPLPAITPCLASGEGDKIDAHRNPPPALTPCPSPEGRGEIATGDPRIALDAGKQMEVLFYLRLGASRRMAARQVGCCHRTIARAAARDPDFARELARAEADADEKCLHLISRATDQEKYWRAAAWVLERRNPEEFAARKPHTFSAGHVLELFTRFLHAVLPKLPADCRETLLDEFDDLAGELVRDPNAVPDRAKLEVKDVPPAPVTAPPAPPPPELKCPHDEAAAREWIRGLSEADSERVWERARQMPNTRDWNHWRGILREESDKQYLQELKERKERKRRRALELAGARPEGQT